VEPLVAEEVTALRELLGLDMSGWLADVETASS